MQKALYPSFCGSTSYCTIDRRQQSIFKYTLEDNTYERNGSSEDGRLPAKFLKSRSAQDSACHNVPQIKTQEMNHKDFFRELANENV